MEYKEELKLINWYMNHNKININMKKEIRTAYENFHSDR